MSSKQRWRFIFQITEGVNRGLGAGPWRLWVHKDEIYIAAAGQVNIIKVSLHSSGRWRVAYTAEHMAGENPLWGHAADRALWKFPATAFVDGVQEVFVVASVRAALRPVQGSGRDAVVPVRDRWDRLTGVRVLVTKPQEGLVPTTKLVFPHPLQLGGGRLVWLQTFDEEIEPVDPEPVPAGQLIRVLTPEDDGVSCPGYLVGGLNVA